MDIFDAPTDRAVCFGPFSHVYPNVFPDEYEDGQPNACSMGTMLTVNVAKGIR